MTKLFLMLGSLGGLLSVALGAFAAHGLKSKLSESLLHTFQTAVEYQFFHSLVLLVIGILLIHKPNANTFKNAGYFVFTGILLFSGSLYFIALTSTTTLGIVTPIGGVFFIIGWLLLTIGSWKEF